MPPHAPVYHCQVAPGERVPVTASVDDPAEHKKAGEAFPDKGDAGVEFTVTDVLVQFEKQDPFSALTK